MGLCRLPRTVCERVGQRWRDGAGWMLTCGIRWHRFMLVRGGCDPIFDCRGTAMGPPNSHFETWRRTQTVRDFPKRTVSEAYPCTTYTCLDPCTHRNGCVWNSSNESRPMRRPWGRRFEMRHDGSTQAPSDSYRGPGVTLVQQTHPSYACMQALSGRGS